MRDRAGHFRPCHKLPVELCAEQAGPGEEILYISPESDHYQPGPSVPPQFKCTVHCPATSVVPAQFKLRAYLKKNVAPLVKAEQDAAQAMFDRCGKKVLIGTACGQCAGALALISSSTCAAAAMGRTRASRGRSWRRTPASRSPWTSASLTPASATTRGTWCSSTCAVSGWGGVSSALEVLRLGSLSAATAHFRQCRWEPCCCRLHDGLRLPWG